MKSPDHQPAPHSPPASGSYVEDQAGTRELLHSRRSEEGHDVFVVREQASGDRFLVHSLAVDATASPEARQAVVSAARQAVAFHHPSVLPVLTVEGSTQNLILMQSFPGGALLADWLAQNGPMPPLAALQALRPFANALLRAQALGLVIPQVSPQDFIVGHNGASLICLCPPVPQGWWLEVSDPAFASPEQQRGQPCDVLSSMYSAGALLAWLVTGTHPAQGEAWAAWVGRQSFPPALKAAVLAVLHDAPPQRCAPSAWEQLLAEAGTGPPAVPARDPSPPPRAPLAAAPRQVRRLEPSAPVAPASRRRLLAGVVVAALVMAGLGVMQHLHQDTGRAAASNRTSLEATPVSVAPSRPVETKPPSTTIVPTVPEEVVEQPPASPSSTLPPPVEPPPAPPPPTAPVADTPPPAFEAPPLVASTPAPSLDPPLPVPSAPAPSMAEPEVPRARVATVEEELLNAARAAPPQDRAALYREVLKAAPGNAEALHALVEDAQGELPKDAAGLQELRGWSSSLERLGDPLGDYALGRLLLEQARNSRDLRTAASSLSEAVTHLGQAADKGYGRAWFLLLQGLVNLHNVQQQEGNARQAARTGRTLFEKIAAIPPEMPVADTRLLAERLQQLVTERAAHGRPHPQADFLRRVVQRLEAITSRREERVSQTP